MTDEFDSLDALAADYVLGTQSAAERREIQARLTHDQDLARRVSDWTQRLSPIAESLPSVAPPPRVWQAIQARIVPGQVRPAAAGFEAIERALTRRLARWRWGAMAAGAMAAALALYVAATVMTPPKSQDGQFIAMLNEGSAGPTWFVTVDLETQRLTIRPLGKPPSDDQAFELWLVAGADSPPRSLGLLDPAREISLPLVDSLSAAALPDAVLAVSLEPAGGSPTGLPTGPVLYQGALLPLSK